MKSKVTRREVERQFRHLLSRHRLPHSEEPVAEIIYPNRFTTGRCVIGLIIPIANQPVEKVAAVFIVQQHYHHPPAFINSKQKVCLRLAYRFRNIGPAERARVHRNAKDLAEWIWDVFGITKVIISPTPGLINARWRLRLLRG